MLIFLSGLLGVVGATGITWYVSSSSEFRPLFGCFIMLLVTGLVSASAHYIRDRPFRVFATAMNGMSAIFFVAIVVIAFTVSPGSGVAALSLIAVPIAINMASLNGMRIATSK